MTKEQYSKILSDLNNVLTNNIDEDNQFDEESQKYILQRDKFYSQLLEHFVDITTKRNESKEKHKWQFFWIIMGLLISLNILIIAIVGCLLMKCNASQLMSAIPVFITAIAGFVSSIIAIPLSITKYLFSTKEDKYIKEIISHTQEHDLSGRKILKTTVDVAKPEHIHIS